MSQGRDWGEDFNRSIKTLGVEFVARILSMIHKRTIPAVQDNDLKKWVIYSPLIDKHNSTVQFASVDIEKSDQNSESGLFGYFRRIPANPYLYQLTQTNNGTFLFPIGATKYGAEGKFTGTEWIVFTDHDDLDMGSGAFSFMCWIKLTGTGTHALWNKRDIANSTNAGFESWISGGDTINIRIADGTNTALLSALATGLNDGSWHSIFINIPSSGNIEVFVDNVSKGTQARGSVASINNARNFYFGARDNAGTLQDKAVMSFAWWSWKRGYIVSSTDRTNFHSNNILVLNEANNVEVTSIDFAGGVAASPTTVLPLFRFST